jgi:hypothetical protein
MLKSIMGEREPDHEIIHRGDLYFLSHPGKDEILSGYGLAIQAGRKDSLVGLLMVDRPHPVDSLWLSRVAEAYGEYQLVPMTSSGEQGILCCMQIEPESAHFLKQIPFEKAYPIQEALQPLLEHLPKPAFQMRWDEERSLWVSQILRPNELPEEIKEIFKKTGYGCMAVESDIGVVHVCHASNDDIAGFENKPVISQWQLIEMPTAPLIRLELIILDHLECPYLFESFLNVAEEDQANILVQLANQDKLYLTFYGDDLTYQYAKIIPHDIQQWQLLDEMTEKAKRYWESLPPEQRDFTQAKANFIRST